jgi:hypothetical protein
VPVARSLGWGFHHSSENRSVGDMEHEQTVEYESPEIADYGDLVELTAGQNSGDFTDAAFPAGTPFRNLTFSNA